MCAHPDKECVEVCKEQQEWMGNEEIVHAVARSVKSGDGTQSAHAVCEWQTQCVGDRDDVHTA
jgi:hypothetical protein